MAGLQMLLFVMFGWIGIFSAARLWHYYQRGILSVVWLVVGLLSSLMVGYLMVKFFSQALPHCWSQSDVIRCLFEETRP